MIVKMKCFMGPVDLCPCLPRVSEEGSLLAAPSFQKVFNVHINSSSVSQRAGSFSLFPCACTRLCALSETPVGFPCLLIHCPFSLSPVFQSPGVGPGTQTGQFPCCQASEAWQGLELFPSMNLGLHAGPPEEVPLWVWPGSLSHSPLPGAPEHPSLSQGPPGPRHRQPVPTGPWTALPLRTVGLFPEREAPSLQP